MRKYGTQLGEGVGALGVTALASNIISTEFLENITSQTLKVAFHSFNIILSFPHPLPHMYKAIYSPGPGCSKPAGLVLILR